MNVFKLDKYINRVQSMIERKRKAVRNSQGDKNWRDVVQLDFYEDKLKSLLSMKKTNVRKDCNTRNKQKNSVPVPIC